MLHLCLKLYLLQIKSKNWYHFVFTLFIYFALRVCLWSQLLKFYMHVCWYIVKSYLHRIKVACICESIRANRIEKLLQLWYIITDKSFAKNVYSLALWTHVRSLQTFKSDAPYPTLLMRSQNSVRNNKIVVIPNAFNKRVLSKLLLGRGDNLQLFISRLLKYEEWLYNIIDDKISFEFNSLGPSLYRGYEDSTYPHRDL